MKEFRVLMKCFCFVETALRMTSSHGKNVYGHRFAISSISKVPAKMFWCANTDYWNKQTSLPIEFIPVKWPDYIRYKVNVHRTMPKIPIWLQSKSTENCTKVAADHVCTSNSILKDRKFDMKPVIMWPCTRSTIPNWWRNWPDRAMPIWILSFRWSTPIWKVAKNIHSLALQHIVLHWRTTWKSLHCHAPTFWRNWSNIARMKR